MVGIVSCGVYVPLYRMKYDDIAKAWGGSSLPGERAVANFDEDSLTMAVEASTDCIRSFDRKRIDGLFLATTTSPYKEKQAAAIIASALDLSMSIRTADFTDSLRSGAIAVSAAVDSISNGSARNVLVTASDCRMGAAQSTFEQQFGDGAAAIMIGGVDVIASVEGSYSVADEFTDLWRTEEDTFVRSWEVRFTRERYMSTMQEVISELMRKYKLLPRDFSKVVFYAPDTRSHSNLAKSLGFDLKTQVQDPLFTVIGNSGTAASLIMLVAALEEAKPGDKILFASYGDGGDAFIFDVTENIKKIRNNQTMKDRLERKAFVSYEKYLSWRNLVPTEQPRRPETPAPSITCLWRERKKVLALYGVKCRQCGTAQYPPQRVCTVCQAKDDFEDYRFSDKKGQVFTYAIDYLTATKNPPSITAIVDFDGGGRMVCEITDCDPDKIEIGMPVEMTFKKLYQIGGIHNYFWKARPVKP